MLQNGAGRGGVAWAPSGLRAAIGNGQQIIRYAGVSGNTLAPAASSRLEELRWLEQCHRQ